MGVFNLFGLVGTRKDGRRSEWSFHLNHEKPSSQIGRKSMWENVYYRKFTILSILATTFPLLNKKRKKKKKVTTFLLSLIIVIRIFHKIYSNQLSIFSTFHPFYQIHSEITFSIIQLFYASYIIYYISLCHP